MVLLIPPDKLFVSQPLYFPGFKAAIYSINLYQPIAKKQHLFYQNNPQTKIQNNPNIFWHFSSKITRETH